MSWIDVQREAIGSKNVDGLLTKFALNHPTYVRENAGGDREFGLWLFMVDRKMRRLVGIGHRDIADWHWHDAFDDGVSPSEAARDALGADDTFSELFG